MRTETKWAIFLSLVGVAAIKAVLLFGLTEPVFEQEKLNWSHLVDDAIMLGSGLYMLAMAAYFYRGGIEREREQAEDVRRFAETAALAKAAMKARGDAAIARRRAEEQAAHQAKASVALTEVQFF